MPNFSMSCGRYVSTGFGPVSSAVGMFEPVTTTRSTSAVDGAAAVASVGTAGAGNCANALDAKLNDCSRSLLRSVNFLLQNCASLRHALQKLNDRNLSALSALPPQRTVIFVILESPMQK